MTVTKTNNTISVPTIDNVIGNKKKNTTIKIEELIKKDDEITLEDLAPDDGRDRWIIVLAIIFIFMTTISQAKSFSIIFSDFFEASGHEGMISNLSNSFSMSGYSIGSLLTNTLLERYSTRPVGILGALCYSVSTILFAFIRNVYHSTFFYLFQGFGQGLIFTVYNTILNTYFVKKRMIVMCTVYTIIGLGGIIYLTSVVKMMTLYGFRGTVAIWGAISLTSIVGMILMHPVEWHVKKLDNVRAEKARIKQHRFQELALSNRRSTIDVIHTFSKNKWNSLHSLKEESGAEMPLLNKTLKRSAQRVASNFEIEDEIRERAKSVSMRESLTRRASDPSASSLVNVATSVGALSDIRQEYLEKKSWEQQTNKEIQEQKQHEKQDMQEDKQEEKQKGIKYKVILGELLDMSLVKNCHFLILCFGVCLVCSTDNAFFFCVPLIMANAGYTKRDTALTIMISETAELASKILLTVFTLIVDVKAKYLFFAATIVMNFPRLGFLYMDTLMDARIMLALIGVVRSWFILQFLVIIEDVSTEKFASAYGISGIIGGIFSIVFNTIAGLIKDWTGSFFMYQVCQLVLNNAFIIPWTLQFIFVDFKKWRKQRAQETII